MNVVHCAHYLDFAEINQATIDHDFGEDKRLLELRTDHITALNDKKSNLKKELSTYILKLYKAAQKTKRAEDRQLYEKYLAGAAVILALAVEGSEKETIMNEIQAHERLWGNTWLVDDVYKSPSNAWQKVKEAL